MRGSASFYEAYKGYVHQWHVDNELRPETTARSSNQKVLWQCDVVPSHTWIASPNSRFKATGKVLGCPKCSGAVVDTGVNDLATRFPEVAEQWSPRNSLHPSEVHAFSNKKFWWVGGCGHEWNSSVVSRTRQNDGCPYCSGHRVLTGFNDLVTTHPHLLPEWDDDRDITTVSFGSAYAAQWKCLLGHVWKTSVCRRSKGDGCPYCGGKKVLAGFNDLESQLPNLAAIWSASNDRKASEVSIGSGYRATWRCGEGHTTVSTVRDRVNAAAVCPVCEGTTLVPGITDFSTVHPKLAEEWIGGIKHPSEVRAMSSVKARWRCGNNHEWEAPFSRRSLGHGCPYCAGQQVVEDVNDFASRFPELVKEWHPSNPLLPSQVSKSSSTVYKWVCEAGHTWEVSPNQRISHHEGVTGCPICFSNGNSAMEADMAEFITMHYPGSVIRRHKLGRLELDVYLPDESLAFEFNGVHWHSELRGKGKTAHIKKMSACHEAGITLIQVWEDDWRDRRTIMEKMILRKIGGDTSPRVGARTTTPAILTARQTRKFLDDTHIQGFIGGSNYDALVSRRGDVVAVMVTTNLKKCVRIDRYATSVNVPGGFSRLLNVITTRAREAGYATVITFSDNEISDGNLYSGNGFTNVGDIAPDYKYLYAASRVHKFLFRKERFRRDAKLKYDPAMTESELAELNGLTRVWDSGKVKWELDVR